MFRCFEWFKNEPSNQSNKLRQEKSIFTTCSSAGVTFFHSGSQRTLRLAGNWCNGTDSLWIYRRSWKKPTTHPIQSTEKVRYMLLSNLVKCGEMMWNLVKYLQSNLSIHHKLVAINTLPHPTAKHEARQCTSLNLRVLPQNHLDRPWPSLWGWKVMTDGAAES